ncbi:MAG: EMC3/TMCO1 family protein [Candidatus Bathyarchaeia archaeon]
MSLGFLESQLYLAFFTVLIALALSSISTLASRKLVDRQLLADVQREISEWRAQMEIAKKTGDKKLIAKLKKQELRIMQMRAKVSAQQLKVMLVTFVPFIVVWWILMPYLYKPAAFIPLFGSKIELPFIVWYIICSFFFHTILSKIFK